jgi:small multidrug resistance family-3 protein
MGAIGRNNINDLWNYTSTFQAENNFGRIYAAYGGIFIILSTFWGWWIEGNQPDIYDWLGAAICMVGISIIMWAPRSG